jgi:hypothetical protein
MKPFLHSQRALLWLGVVMMLVPLSGAYSVLSHEQVVDLLWQDRILPLVKMKYPGLTSEQIKEAHAYAYGGSLVQDMGYYPFGSKFFSDLTHYVRTGEFVTCLIQESSTADEYAFALGALAHYVADNQGHPAINRAVAMEFSGLRKKYGDVVTYEDSPKAHIRAEFGFDMTEVAKNHYTSDTFHDFIGFEISEDLLERALPKVYGIDFADVVNNEDVAIGTFRYAVSKVIPEMTRVALLARKKEIVKDTPNAAKKRYLYYLSRSKYESEWGTEYRHPGFGARVLGFFLRIIPKVGPFGALNFKIPPPKAEDLFIKSIDDTVENYGRLLTQVEQGNLHLEDKDFDTGHETRPAEYSLADKAYAHLLGILADNGFNQVSPELRENVLAYYANPDSPVATKLKPKDWKRLQEDLQRLKNTPAIPQIETVRNAGNSDGGGGRK